ncbi:MAG: GAF domain-containing sensor histidine kinase, partial [Anaerolineales bacterium]|nr:GAF domain-containing sensor histidine kinase [Anaerolineales bacterium]
QLRVGRPALALIPLIAGRRRIGNLILSYTQPHPWSDAELRLFRLAANLIATSVENTRHFQREQELAAVEERQRLARDLHDSVTQLIFSVMLIAQSVGPAFKKNVAEGERRIQRMLDLSQQALTEMRALLAELRPVSPVEQGLLPALRQHVDRISARERLQIQLIDQNYRPQVQTTEEALFRIVQEALNNTLKHARAKTVEIALGQTAGQIVLTVSDNGRGFSPENSAEQATESRFGIRGMRERVSRLGGRLDFDARPGIGTTIRVTLPDQPISLEHEK